MTDGRGKTTSYVYGALGKLRTVKDPDGGVILYQYDLEGNLVSKTDKNGYHTEYEYDRQNVILETDAKDKVKTRYVKGINYIASLNASNKISYFLFNGHGDVVQTVDKTGEVLNHYEYDIWRNPILTVEIEESAIRYAGEFYDSETGLYYLRARYYDPYIGRFLSEDSYWGEDNNPLSLNRYTYTHNDPIQYLDPTGYAVIKKGSTGDKVVAVQDMLKGLGYNTGKIDGKFGSQTEAAIKQFQKDNGLKVDGIVGNQSITALKALTSVKNAPQSEKDRAKEHIAEQKVGDIKPTTIIEPKKNTTNVNNTANNKANNTANNKANNTIKATTETNIVASITVEIKNNTVIITGMDIKDANSKNTEISNQPLKAPTPVPAPTSVPEEKKEEVVRPGYTVGPVAGSVPDSSLRAQYATDDDYVNRTIRQIVLGDYTDDVTLLGTIMQVVSGILGIDGATDLRDLSASVLQWEWTGEHVLAASINVVALLPVIGAIKYADEVGTIIKNSDEVGDVVKGVSKNDTLWGTWNDYEKVTKNGQSYAEVGDRLYSPHAVDRMQPSGNKYGSSITQAGGDYGRSVAPQYVEDVISSVKPIVQENGNLKYVDGSLEIITNKQGDVVTIMTK